MPNADDHVTDDVTVDDLEAHYEGSDFSPIYPSVDYFICDDCLTYVPYTTTERLSQYIVNNIINDEHPDWQHVIANLGTRPFTPLETLCADCTTRRLLLPCEGYAEVRLTFDMGNDRTLRNVEITDFSPEEDGIPWDPADLCEQVTGVPFDENPLLTVAPSSGLWGPEDIIRLLNPVGVDLDLSNAVRADGTFDPQALQRAQEVFDGLAQELQRNNFSR